MNPTALAMVPMTTNNPTQPSNSATSNSTAKFGDVLEGTLSNKGDVSELSTTKTDLTTEQKKVIEDLLAFLEVDSLLELEDGSALLEALMPLNDEDESVIAELLASIANLNISVPEENETNHTDVLSGILSELSTQETQDGLDIPSEIYALLQQLDRLDVKEWSKLDVDATGNLLKVAKLQDLISSQKDLSQDAALIQKEIKNLLESISGKLEKWLGSQPNKSGNEAAFAVFLENGSNKSLDVVKQAYDRVLSSEGETTGKTVSNGLTLKASETNTQSSGLPFQMTKLEQFVLTASKNGQAVDSEQFVKSFENILSKANFSNANGVQKLLIRLNPENLGSLRIELIQKDGTMVAKILATTAQAKELLDRQVQGLKHAFMNQNIQVEKIEISQQMSTFNAERFAPRDQGQHEQRQQQTTQKIIEDEETDFTDRFEELLLNLKV